MEKEICRIIKRKEWYMILSWTYIKGKRKVPQEINDILDMIEYIENKNG